MSSLAITGGRVLDPADGVDARADVWISDGHIVAVGDAPAGFHADSRIDATGLVVCPGLVDLCARLREPGQTHKGTIVTETGAAVAGGITALCVPPDTVPPLDSPATVELVRGRAREAARARVHPVGALTRDLDGSYLAPLAALAGAGCIAVGQADRAVRDTHVLRSALEYAATLGLTVMLPPCDPTLAGGCAHAGGPSTRLGLGGIPAAAETAELERILALAGDTGCPVHVGRLSAADSVDLLRAARDHGVAATADVAAHQLHLTEAAISGFDSRVHLRPPLRGAGDRDALRAAVADGTIDAVCSDHQPHDADAKLAPFARTEPGLSGLETFLPLVLDLVRAGECELATALARITHGPAGAAGLRGGSLAPGSAADLCLFAVDESWTLDPATMHSRGRNTPFAGEVMTGRVHVTVIGGSPCFRLPA